MGFLKRFRLFLALTGLLWVGRPLAAEPLGVDEIALEYQVKAAYIFNFARFVTWPDGTFASPETPLVIGVVGQGPLVNALEKTVNGKTIEGRALVVHEMTDTNASQLPQMVVITKSAVRRTPSVLKSLQDKPILSVSEISPLSKQAGIVRLWVDEDKVRFTVNLTALELSGLVASSQMLQYADIGH